MLLGGPLTGTAIADPSRTVVTQTTQAVLLMSRKPPLRTTGCIRCGWCVSGCPVGGNPIATLDALEANPPRALPHPAVHRCIDCGVCSAVCPSHLPLAQAARTARMRLAHRTSTCTSTNTPPCSSRPPPATNTRHAAVPVQPRSEGGMATPLAHFLGPLTGIHSDVPRTVFREAKEPLAMQLDLQIGLIDSEDQLEDMLSAPTQALCDTLSRLDGDIMVLGAGGKMGPTLAKLARRAIDLCGSNKQVIGVSRFSSDDLYRDLNESGIRTIHCDLLDEAAVANLPDAPNVIYLAGRKFGTDGNAAFTWAMNTYVPALVARRFRASRIVALSTGNVYPLSPVASSGPNEADPVGPVGEYAQSCLGRERIFEYFCNTYRTPMTLVRLNYAVELRYGVLLDIARKVRFGQPIDLASGYVNVIWQRDANEAVLRCLEICKAPPEIVNLAGPRVSVRELAERFGKYFGLAPVFAGGESDTALLSDGSKAERLFGPATICLEAMVKWVAHWVLLGGKMHDLPTHYEQRQGHF